MARTNSWPLSLLSAALLFILSASGDAFCDVGGQFGGASSHTEKKKKNYYRQTNQANVVLGLRPRRPTFFAAHK